MICRRLWACTKTKEWEIRVFRTRCFPYSVFVSASEIYSRKATRVDTELECCFGAGRTVPDHIAPVFD